MTASATPSGRVELTLRNPSPYTRGGPIVAPWQPVAAAGSLRSGTARVFYDGMGVPTQVDRLDPDDSSRDQLVFSVDERVEKSEEDDYRAPCGTVAVHEGPQAAQGSAWVEVHPTGVKLGNGTLQLWVNTSAASPREDHRDDHWFGGAVTSVQLHGMEMLDAHGAAGGYHHHPDIRCMQVDRVHLVRPPWNVEGSEDVYLHNRNWRTVSAHAGAVRATAVIASDPFRYSWKDTDGKPRIFDCAVYRAISLYPDVDWVGEEIWVKATPGGEGRPAHFWFVPRYFMMSNMSAYPDKFRYPDHPGWFVITSPAEPRQGYGFATDSMAGPLWHPPLDYPQGRTRHRSFSWELGATRFAHSVHIFRQSTTPREISDAIGLLWYKQVYKPMRATL
ncbi:MAG TPA: hypothetical protein VGR02_13195 [Thermoanaerobaculia bacterium]|jgi:hypothetical protein|nr:hypothetical protein [Thermoanaerobaculia bacterium]